MIMLMAYMMKGVEDTMACPDKKRYPNELEANIAVANQQLKASKHRKHGKKGVEIPIRSYACPHCHGWHTTSQTKKNQNAGN